MIALIVYLTGIVPAYFLLRKDYIDVVLAGDKDDFTLLGRSMCLLLSIGSWVCALIALVKIVLRIMSESDWFNKPAKW